MSEFAIRNHLLVTADEAVRGLVVPCIGRLTDHLRTTAKHFLTLESAEERNFAGADKHVGAKAMVATDQIVWAHEYAAIKGDDHQRRHYLPEDEAAVRLTLSRPTGLILEGYVTLGWLATPSRFGVVREPRAVGLTPLAERHASEMAGLHYVVVNRDVVAVVSFLD
jgi:hypothetical protein